MRFAMYMAIIASMVAITAGCTTKKTVDLRDNNFNSTLWVQSASEYRANSMQAYNSALKNLDEAMEDVALTAIQEQSQDYSALPAAIILDIDETVLDNSQYQAQLLIDGDQFDPETWDKWIAARSAPAIPGSVNFINNVRKKGVEVIYITNRECKFRDGVNDICPQKRDTIENLKTIGISDVSEGNMMLKNEKPEWTSEKKSRREEVAKNYRVIMLFGDDLGDFLPDVKKNITSQERDALVIKYSSYWGVKWFSFANPTYGSWLRILDEPKSNHLRGY